MTITADHFPTSPLALRTANPNTQTSVRAFADRMAEAANAARDQLTTLWASASTQEQRASALHTVHESLIQWRYQTAVHTGRRLGTGIGYNPDRFVTPITDQTINYDRLGYIGRLRDGTDWDETTRTYRGGQTTPAHQTMIRYGAAAEKRFEREAPEADVLSNWIALADGRRIAGNRILRGAAAATVADELAARVAARGLDATRMETGGHPIYTATPAEQDSRILFTEALKLLSNPACTTGEFLTARYLMFQSPRTKKGSDAVNRVFTVTVGSLLLGDDAPTLPADIDLRCYVLGQTAATQPLDA
ncbi:hypothetical protein ACIOJD_33930 [Streptomyces sp. NPDC088116]|uniref:hypothetical protein n=1 Tax=Streptomyces sp. NPDC088116 TaxID=3365825 RepID=UPI0037F68B66